LKNSQSDYEGFVCVERICSLFHDESHHGERELKANGVQSHRSFNENMPPARPLAARQAAGGDVIAWSWRSAR
jgi:hypothetical protein